MGRHQGQHRPRRAGRHDHFQSRPHHRGRRLRHRPASGLHPRRLLDAKLQTRGHGAPENRGTPVRRTDLRPDDERRSGRGNHRRPRQRPQPDGHPFRSVPRRMSRRQSLRLVPHRRHEGRRSHRRLGTPRAGNPAGRKRGLRPLGQHGHAAGRGRRSERLGRHLRTEKRGIVAGNGGNSRRKRLLHRHLPTRMDRIDERSRAEGLHTGTR